MPKRQHSLLQGPLGAARAAAAGLRGLPAAVAPADAAACKRVVADAVRALRLQTGVFGMQLKLDPRRGCTETGS